MIHKFLYPTHDKKRDNGEIYIYITYKLITKLHTNKHGHKENILFKRRTKIFYFLRIFIFIEQTHNKK